MADFKLILIHSYLLHVLTCCVSVGPPHLPPSYMPPPPQGPSLGALGQAPMQTPIGQSPIGQSPIGQTPIGQTPIGQAPQIPPSSSGSDEEARASPPNFTCPPRPNQGTDGKTILLKANHFQVAIPKGFIHHYDISITPDKCPRRVNR